MCWLPGSVSKVTTAISEKRWRSSENISKQNVGCPLGAVLSKWRANRHEIFSIRRCNVLSHTGSCYFRLVFTVNLWADFRHTSSLGMAYRQWIFSYQVVRHWTMEPTRANNVCARGTDWKLDLRRSFDRFNSIGSCMSVHSITSIQWCVLLVQYTRCVTW